MARNDDRILPPDFFKKIRFYSTGCFFVTYYNIPFISITYFS